MRKDLHEINRRAWKEATRAHNSHKADQARFLRNGGSTLFPEELELPGDVRDKRVLHLQCNAGQDTLSLAQLGASVTGVDISDEAITFACRLSAESGIPATFHRADLYDWLDDAVQRSETFDIVFSSYGFLVWLSDIYAWARGIAAVLAPGGRFVMIEFHPFLMMLDDQGRTIASSYGGGRLWSFDEGIGDYVAWAGVALTPSGYLEGMQNFRNPYPPTNLAGVLENWSQLCSMLVCVWRRFVNIRMPTAFRHSKGQLLCLAVVLRRRRIDRPSR